MKLCHLCSIAIINKIIGKYYNNTGYLCMYKLEKLYQFEDNSRSKTEEHHLH